MRTDIAAAFAIGSEMSGGAHDIVVARLNVPSAEHALYFKANRDRGGVIERIAIRDIAVAKAETLIRFTADYHGYRGGNAPPTFRDLRVSDVRCAACEVALHIVGVPDAPVERLRLADITASARKPNRIEHVRDSRLDGMAIDARSLNSALPNKIIGQTKLDIAVSRILSIWSSRPRSASQREGEICATDS